MASAGDWTVRDCCAVFVIEVNRDLGALGALDVLEREILTPEIRMVVRALREAHEKRAGTLYAGFRAFCDVLKLDPARILRRYFEELENRISELEGFESDFDKAGEFRDVLLGEFERVTKGKDV